MQFSFPFLVGAKDFDPNLSPSLTINETIVNEPLPDLQWIIEENQQTLDAKSLSEGDLKDGLLLDLSQDKSFLTKGGNHYWFNIQINQTELLDENMLAFYRHGNCWPWGLTFNEVTAFQIKNGSAVPIAMTGTNVPASKRDIPHVITPSVFNIDQAGTPISEIWIRLKIIEACNLKVQLKCLDKAVFLSGRKITSHSTLNIMLIGAVFVLLCFALFLFIKYRENVYAWFLIFLVVQLINRIHIEFPNEIFAQFFSNYPRGVIFTFSMCATSSIALVIQFWKVYINIKDEFPKIHQAINMIILAVIFVFIMGMTIRFTDWNWDYWFKIRQLVMFICSINLLGITLFLIIRGKLLAKLLSIGILSVFLLIAVSIIIINSTPYQYSLNIPGFVGIGILTVLTTALAYRFILANEEKKAALAEKLEVEKVNATKDLKIKYEQAEAAKLKELDSFKSNLFTNLTHEFRTPLTVILGMNGQLKSNPQKHLKEATKLIESNGQNMLKLINQLLDLSKLESKSFVLAEEQGDIVAYLNYLTESYHSFANAKNLSLQFFSNVERLDMVFDPEQVKQVFSNLLSNAIKFTPSGGAIKIKVHVEEKKVKVAITDTGIGIAKDQLPHVFDRFYQGASSDIQKGTGIGLAHSKELIDLMGGVISVESVLGEGATFSFQLPIKKDSTKKILDESHFNKKSLTAPLSETPIPTIKNKQIETLPQLLVIEDNPDVMTYLKSCLEDHFQLDLAYNGQTGIDKALEQIPDLIISDVMMPQKNGFEVCETLKNDERTSHIPIVLLTAKADAASKIAGLKRGADAYLAKPFDKEELLVRLAQLVERQQKLKAHFSAAQGDKTPSQLPPEVVEIEDAFIQKVRKIVSDYYSDENFSLPVLCQKVRMSRSQLFRKMKALINTSPSEFIRDYRLNTAKTLLETSDLNVSEVAWQCGFKDISHFSKSFLDKFGVLPSATNK